MIGIMTIWHVQKLYKDTGAYYEVLPYTLFSTLKYTLKMRNGIQQTVKFLVNSRLSEKSAEMLAYKKNVTKVKSRKTKM